MLFSSKRDKNHTKDLFEEKIYNYKFIKNEDIYDSLENQIFENGKYIYIVGFENLQLEELLEGAKITKIFTGQYYKFCKVYLRILDISFKEYVIDIALRDVYNLDDSNEPLYSEQGVYVPCENGDMKARRYTKDNEIFKTRFANYGRPIIREGKIFFKLNKLGKKIAENVYGLTDELGLEELVFSDNRSMEAFIKECFKHSGVCNQVIIAKDYVYIFDEPI